jgi:hypothetical protein
MGERQDRVPDEALGDLVLPLPSGIGRRNAAMTGGAPTYGPISITTLVVPTTVSFDKMDS